MARRSYARRRQEWGKALTRFPLVFLPHIRCCYYVLRKNVSAKIDYGSLEAAQAVIDAFDPRDLHTNESLQAYKCWAGHYHIGSPVRPVLRLGPGIADTSPSVGTVGTASPQVSGHAQKLFRELHKDNT